MRNIKVDVKGMTRNIKDLEAMGAMHLFEKDGEQMTVRVNYMVSLQGSIRRLIHCTAYIGLLSKFQAATH